jgi:transcriptional regulator
MYAPSHFEETRLEALHALIEAHPLGALVTHGAAGLDADHIPFEIAAPSPDAPFGTLRAHVARANPLWRQGGTGVLVLFQGPSAYVSPSLYLEKPVSGKVVPTYNYAVVHAHGALRAVEDPAWILALLERLTARHELVRAARVAVPAPWSVGDAPPAYIEALLKAIVGIEIPLDRLQGKWKLSQNRPPADQAAVAADCAALAPIMEESSIQARITK